MAIQQADLSNIETLILLIISVILVTLILYLGTRLIAGKDETDTEYVIRLVLVAIIIVILVAIVIGAIVGAVADIDVIGTAATQLVPVLIYLAIVFLIKYILIPEKGEVTRWNASVWIGVITLFLIYFFNALTVFLGFEPIIQGVG